MFSLVMPYHNAPQMLRVQRQALNALPLPFLAHIELVVCDDASDEPPSVEPYALPTTKLYRIPPPHIRWSHRCATNIAAHHATGDWFIVTDIDHVVPATTWRALFGKYEIGDLLDASKVYTFARVNVDGSPYKPHPDSWLMHRDMWRKIGGYDTRYRGHYGQNAAFIDRVKAHASIVPLDLPLIRYTREDIADASMPVAFGRKDPVDRSAVAAMRARFHRERTYFQPGEIVPHEAL